MIRSSLSASFLSTFPICDVVSGFSIRLSRTSVTVYQSHWHTGLSHASLSRISVSPGSGLLYFSLSACSLVRSSSVSRNPCGFGRYSSVYTCAHICWNQHSGSSFSFWQSIFVGSTTHQRLLPVSSFRNSCGLTVAQKLVRRGLVVATRA